MQSLQELKSISQLSGKRGKRYDRTVLLGKATLDAVKVPVSKALINSEIISHDEFLSVTTTNKKSYLALFKKVIR